MEHNHTIAKAFQLLTESIVFFFLLVPVFRYQGFEYPFWSYLFITVITILLFEVGMTYLKSYLVYLPIIAILFLLMFVGFHYPVFVVVLWLGFMTWRNLRFDRHGPDSQPLPTLLITTLLLMIDVMFFNHSNLIWFGVTQIGLIVGGTWLKLLAGSNSISLVKSSYWFFGVLLLIFIGGSVAVYSSYPLLVATIGLILSGVGFIFGKIVLGIVGVLGWLGIDLTFLEGIVDEKTYQQVTGTMGGTVDHALDLAAATPANHEGFNFINGWTISVFVVLIVGMAVFLGKKKTTRERSVVGNRRIVSVETVPSSEDKDRNVNLSERKKPDNPIRRKVLEFEQEALDRGNGRRSTETIEEWFARLNLKADSLDFYQKIRYGEQELNDLEEKQAHDLLEKLRNIGKGSIV
jgi:hypothetical protein